MSENPSNATKSFRLRTVLRCTWFFLAYIGCEYLERAIGFPDPFSPTILPSFGLLFGVLIVYKRKEWPVLAGAGLAASCFFSVVCARQPVLLGAILFGGNFFQAAAGLMLLRMRYGKRFTFRKVRHVVRFCGTVLLIPAIGASISAFAFSRFYGSFTFSTYWLMYWLADVAALVVMTPLVVKVLRKDPHLDGAVSFLRIAEGVLLGVLLLVASDCIFGTLIRGSYPGLVAQPYQIFPILLWAAIRFGPSGASMVSFAVAVAAAWGLSRGFCIAFHASSVMAQALLLDAFLVTSGGFSMIAAALMAERLRSASKFRHLCEKLEALNQTLKLEVAERSSVERMLRAILDGANVCIISTDLVGRILTFNKAAQNLLKYSGSEVIGRMNVIELYAPEEIMQRAELLTRRLGRAIQPNFEVLALTPATGLAHEMEWTYLSRDKTRADVVVFMTALLDQEQQPTGYIVVGRDITLQKRAEAALMETQSAVHNFFENGPLMMGVVEIVEGDADILHISDNIASADFHRTTSETMSQALASSLGDTPRHIGFWIEKYRQSERTGAPVKFEYELQMGIELMHLRVTVSFIAVTSQGRSRFSYVMEDITAYRQAQAQLKRFAAILEATTDFVGMADRTGQTLYLNRAAHRLLGLESDGVPSGHRIFNVHPQWASLLTRREGIPVAMLEGAWQGESALLNREQKEIPVSQVILSHRSVAGEVDFISTIMRDMTEQKLAEERIRTSLTEKEALLKEIHHRVKNNMQVVSSLLQLQSGYTEEPQAKAMFEESRDRIRSMALIHEKLYQTKDLANIDFSEYIPSLVSMIFATQNVRAAAIQSRINVGAITFGVDIAIPLGLIINELVSNSLKHAFKNRDSGTVNIELLKRDIHGYSLVVRDDGVGLPPGFKIEETSSLGLKLVRILTQQIGGELTIANRDGSYFQINFNEAPST
jgi:PAS domain S-box-containing protein